MAELLIHDGALYHRKKLQDEVLTIGREKTCGVLLQAESVSRKHCRLVRRPDGWLLQELDSRNGTWVNGRRLSVEWKLKDGDVVGIGKARLVFRERMTASQTFFWLLVHPRLWRSVAYLIMLVCLLVIGYGVYQGIRKLQEESAHRQGLGDGS